MNTGSLADGRSKLLAFVEDSLTVIEGDIETNGRLVFWWPAGARRVLFQTSGDWAWEYRKQCKYCKGYKYLDADTGIAVATLNLILFVSSHIELVLIFPLLAQAEMRCNAHAR